jgi:hypothetical protein
MPDGFVHVVMQATRASFARNVPSQDRRLMVGHVLAEQLIKVSSVWNVLNQNRQAYHSINATSAVGSLRTLQSRPSSALNVPIRSMTAILNKLNQILN